MNAFMNLIINTVGKQCITYNDEIRSTASMITSLRAFSGDTFGHAQSNHAALICVSINTRVVQRRDGPFLG